MDERQNMEPFSLDGDYVDGQWINGEFFSSGVKRGRAQTKEEALYGYQSSSDDESNGGGGGNRAKRGKYSKPLGFVNEKSGRGLGSEGGGPSRSASEVEMADSEAARLDEEPEENEGLGFGSRRSGLEFRSEESGGSERPETLDSERPGLGSKEPGLGSRNVDSSSRVGASGDDALPTEFGRRIRETAEEKVRSRNDGSSRGSTSGSGNATAKPTFEQFTKGIGSRLLEKMGWKGVGLGKFEQGIAQPIETKVRPKNMGMGFGEFKEDTPTPREPVEPQEHRVRVEQKLWLKKNKNKKREVLTADQLLALQHDRGGESVQKVLDMRGPQVRVVTDMKDLNVEHEVPEDDTPMPELQHNLRLIVNLVESDILGYDRKLRHEEQTLEYLKKDRDRLRRDLVRQESRVDVLTAFMSTVGSVNEGLSMGRINLEGVVSAFKKLRDEHPEEFRVCDMPVVAMSFVQPLLEFQLRGWDPLLQPDRGMQAVKVCRLVFHQETGYDDSIFPEADVSPFSRLLTEAVVPHFIRSCIRWDVRYPQPMVDLLEKWQTVLTSSVLQNFLEHWVLSKLQRQVEEWDPVRDEIAIHTWMHPWLPLLGSRMEPLYIPIRMKLDQALKRWVASDGSAHEILQPWKTVFDPVSWDQLLVRQILPKLMQALDTMVINPAGQDIEPFDWVLRWLNEVPLHNMVGLLELGFFPKWQRALYSWLTLGNPDLEEVRNWFIGWKEKLPDEVWKNDRIIWQLDAALDMMLQAVEEREVVLPGARAVFENVPRVVPPPPPPPRVFVNEDEKVTLKEIVETFAGENDVAFVPKSLVHEGLQVYGFGTVSVTIDGFKEVVLAHSADRGWSSVSLEQLLGMHRDKEAKGGKGGNRWNAS